MDEAGITQADLARHLGTGEAQVNRWVHGKVRPIRIYRQQVAKKLKVAEADLFPREEAARG